MSQSRLLVLAGARRKDRPWHLAASYMHICMGGAYQHITRTETQRTPTTFSVYLHDHLKSTSSGPSMYTLSMHMIYI